MKMKLKFNFRALVFLFVTCCCLSLRSEATATYAYHICPNTTTYTSNSNFRSNLNLLLSTLSSNSTVPSGFYNATVGHSTNDTVYGLFLCRGDLSPESCQDCVTTAAGEIVSTYCPTQKRVVIWYEECMLRYSDQSIISIVDRSFRPTLYNTQNVTDPQGFTQALAEIMTDVETRAASGSGSVGKKFAVAQANYSVLQQLYAMAQCTPDISSNDCTMCLQDAISSLPSCCGGSRGVRVLLPSCNIRYEMYSFYNSTAFPPPSTPPPPQSLPPPPPPLTLSNSSGKGGISSAMLIAIIVPIGVSVLLFIAGICFMKRRSKKKYQPVREDITISTGTDITADSLQFDFATIQAATDNFSDSNKLGEGGFGSVYKGILSNGNVVAVKRLSKSSGQGVVEFKNEAMLVAKLQHRNLVRMLGYCLEGEEKILVYEYVPNRSMDYFLFDSKRKEELDWSKRYKIIGGIARGLVYLHEDSQLRIIHRDLKASNILLDKNMNAKISDFGMARIFGGDQTQGNTSRVVGTFGYMSPEYVLHGHFSVKSDVFSFGVMLLEIISGKKNINFRHEDSIDLLGYAWKLWSNGAPLEFADPALGGSYNGNEVIRCILIGLSCVHENPESRPSMSTVVMMLTSQSVSIQAPQKPAFFPRSTMVLPAMESSESNKSAIKSSGLPHSVNDISITELDPR
ncbi:cysteine-rich receptor-like protein kinase 10 isoform X2 [Impatiens glandulifera]|uniref:cysteine-rich receptor-like protein kinase 10 isoform X2 n=1 Tax=Impatiens glandulifera TaxID=253017 RepID=UPI001FB118E3|nr:cysteine-rich receptor-like protein kinase 10 isoform X2 [Impatiens glandulifera]